METAASPPGIPHRAPARPGSRVGQPPALLTARSLTKRFADVLAVSDVDLTILAGEVHALVGEHGAGKSTLVKIIQGIHVPDEGKLYVDNRPATPGGPALARLLGIGSILRDVRLVPALTVGENIALTLPGGPTLRRDALLARIAEASAAYGLSVDPRARVRHLSVGERRRAEILTVLMAGARLVILDEPTRALAPHEVTALMGALVRLREHGVGVLVVTHDPAEVRALADRVTVLRRGRAVVNGADPAEFTDAELAEAMGGTEAAQLTA